RPVRHHLQPKRLVKRGGSVLATPEAEGEPGREVGSLLWQRNNRPGFGRLERSDEEPKAGACKACHDSRLDPAVFPVSVRRVKGRGENDACCQPNCATDQRVLLHGLLVPADLTPGRLEAIDLREIERPDSSAAAILDEH